MKRKSNKKIVRESLTARIRELEAQVEQQNKTAVTINSLNASLNLSFSRYFTDTNDISELLAFERHTDKLLAEHNTPQSASLDVLYAYLEVFEAVDRDGLLEADADNAFGSEDRIRIKANITAYQSQLKQWANGE